MSATKFNLPQVKNVNINNMLTFPQNQRANFEPGVNVIFGPNHSGKTTIVNSIRYSIFGLSLCHIPKGVEIKYFSSRVNEAQRKSLSISTVYNVKSTNVTVNRTIHASGSPVLEANISELSNNALAIPKKTFDNDTDYTNFLRNEIGISQNNLPLITDLIFADESRQFFLWQSNMEEFVLNLLSPKQISNELKAIENQLNVKKDDLKAIEQKIKNVAAETEQKQGQIDTLRTELSKIDSSDLVKALEDSEKARADRETLRGKILTETNSLQQITQEKMVFLRELEQIATKMQQIQHERDSYLKYALKSFLSSSKDSEKHHLTNCVYHDKKCPICYSDLSAEIDNRIDVRKCPLCGKGELPGDAVTKNEVKAKISTIEITEKALENEKIRINEALTQIEAKMTIINKNINDYRIIELELSEKISRSKATDSILLDKKIIKIKILELTERIKANQEAQKEAVKEAEALRLKADSLQKEYFKKLKSLKTTCTQVISEMKQRFANFVNLASKGDINAALSDQFIPLLDGRQIFHPFEASKSERVIMDYAFRIAILSTCAKDSESVPTLVLETPDDAIDSSYLPTLAQAIIRYSENISVIVTTFNADMIGLLLKTYDLKGKDRQLLTSLLSTQGTVNQKNHFEEKLMKYFSEE